MAFLLGCIAAPAFAQVQRSFANPGFETPDLVTAGCRVYINQSQVPGWSTTHANYATENSGGCVVNGSAGTTNLGTSPGPIIELWKTPRNNSSGGEVDAPGGTQIAELNAALASRLYQSVCLMNGEQVNWQFDHRGRGSATTPDVANVVIGGSTVVATVDTTNNGTFTTPTANLGTATGANISGNATWVKYSGSFNYPGVTGLTNFGFEAVGGTTSGNLLDDVQLALAPVVDFVSPSSSDLEGDSGSNLLANRPTLRVNGTVTAAFTVTVTITGGTAANGTDYFTNTATGTSNTLSVSVPAGVYDGVTTGLFQLPVYVAGNTTVQSNRDIQFTIQSGTDYLLSSNTTCGGTAQTTWDYTIIDDDGALAVTKTASAPVLVSGAQYDITYTIVVDNSSGVSRTYSLTDTPSFDADVTINSLTALSCTRTGGSTCGGTLLGTPVNSAGPWALDTSHALADGQTETYTMTVRFTVNAGQTGNDSCGASGAGLFNSVAATVTGSGAGTFTASACQNTPTLVWVTLNKQLPNRAATTDQIQVRMLSGGIAVTNGSATTSGTGTSASTGQIVLPAGSTLQFTEALKAGGTGTDQAPSNYIALLSCTNATTGSATVPPSGSGTAQATQQAWPEFTPAAGDVLNCTITNTLAPGTLTVTKNITGGPATTSAMAFPFSVACSTPDATYSGTVDVAANATTGSTTVSIPAGSTNCTISEGTQPTAPTNYTWGTPTYTQPAATAMAAGGTASGTIVNPLNTLPSIAVTKTVKTVNGSPANSSTVVGAGDQIVYTLTYSNSGQTAGVGTAYEVVPQNTILTAVAATGTTACTLSAAAGTACQIDTASAVPGNGTTTVDVTVQVNSPLPANTTSIYNLASTALPNTCTANGACTTPPTGPSCTAPASCTNNPTSIPSVTVAKTVDATTPNPIGANQDAVFDLTVTNTVTGTTQAAGYQFYEVVPQNTTFTAISNGTTDCTLPAAAGTLCTITVTNAVVAGTDQVVEVTFTTLTPLPAGLTSVYNVATQDLTVPPGAGCTTSGTVCTTPPTNTCPSGDTCASVTTVSPSITVTKTTSATSASAGAPISYTLTAANGTGTNQAAGYVTYEVVPQNTTFTSISGATSDCTGGEAAGTLCAITWPAITANSSVVATVVVTPVNPLPAGTTTIFNLATSDDTPPTGCTAGTPGTCATPPTSCTGTQSCVSTPVTAPSITVTKTTSATSASAGAPISYTLTAANGTGTNQAAGYVTYEVVPQNTTFTSISGATSDCTGGEAAGTLCAITWPAITANSSVVATVVVTPVNPLPAGTTTIFNLATSDDTPPTGCTAGTPGTCATPPTSCTGTQSCVSTPVTAPSITVTKTTSATSASAGAPISYTLTAANGTGTNQAAGYVTYEVVPQNTTFTSISGATSDCTGGEAAGTLCAITWPAITANSSVVATVVVTPVNPLPAGTTTIFNLATSDDTPPTGCTAGTPGTCATPPTSCTGTQSCVSTPVTAPSITVTKTTSATSASAGAPISYTLTAANGTGTNQAAGYVTYEVVPQNTTFTSISGATSDCTGGEAAGTLCAITWPAITANSSVVATVVVTPVNPLPAGTTTIFNLATSDDTPPTGCTAGTPGTCATPPTSCTGTQSCVSTPVTAPSITVTKTTSATSASAGAPISYTLTAANGTGTNQAAGYVTYEVVPQNTTFTSISGATSDCTGGEAAGTLCAITWPAITANSSVVATVVVTPVNPLPAGTTTIFNLATSDDTPPTGCTAGTPGTCATPPTSCTGTQSCVSTPVTAPSITVTKTTSATSASAGAPISYTLTAANGTGTNQAAGYVTYEVVPQNTTFTSISGATSDCTGGEAAGTLCAITWPAITANSSVVATVVVTPVNPLPAGTTTIFNLATSDDTPPTGCTAGTPGTCATPPTSCTGTQSCVSTPVTAPSITVTKTTSATSASAGAPISYTLTAANGTGTNQAAGYVTYEVVPQNTTFTSISGATSDCTGGEAAGTLCAITWPAITANSSVVATVVVTPVNPLPAGTTTIFNLATSDDTPPTGCTAGTPGTCATPPTSCTGTQSCVSTPVTAPSITVTKTTSATSASAGAPISYTLTAANGTGTNQAAGYVTYEVVPQNTTFTSISGATSDCTGGEAAGTLCAITWPAITANSSVVATVVVTPVNPLPAGTTTIFNLATSDDTPPTGCTAGTPGTCATPPTSCTGTQSCVSTPVTAPSITVTKTTSATSASAGAPISYTLTAANGTGTNQAAGYVTYEVVPQNTTFTSISGATSDCTGGEAAGTLCAITWPAITANSSVVATVVVTPVNPLPAGTTTIFNLATSDDTPPTGCTAGTPGTCATPPTSCTGTQSCVSTPVTAPSITVTKTLTSVNGSAPGAGVKAGDVLVYTITSVNSGGATASVGLTETVPAQTIYAGGGSAEGTWTGCTAGTTTNPTTCTQTQSVGAGASVSTTFTVQVNAQVTAGAIVNTVMTDTGDCTSCSPSIPVVTFDPPFIAKSVDATGLPTLTWTIVVDNDANAAAQYTEVRDAVPAGLSYVSGSITCTQYGSSAISSCAFDSANNRVLVDATLASDVGAANPATAPNRVVIVFQAKYTAATPSAVTNTALACYDPNDSQGAVSACTQSVSAAASYVPQTTPSVPTQPVPLDARWMLVWMAFLLSAAAAMAMRGRASS
ncbi:MAG: hypothetical protein QM741_01560 [Rudaea sp.]|uniref:hypothetical protein n=1 Tax=Rudaea sp. TaxID=2136325 RepID=UPI0039E42D32